MADALDKNARATASAMIVAKRDALSAERAELLERRSALLARMREVDRELADCRAAARLFSLPIDFPAEDPGDAQRETVIMQQHEFSVRRAQQLAAADAAAKAAP